MGSEDIVTNEEDTSQTNATTTTSSTSSSTTTTTTTTMKEIIDATFRDDNRFLLCACCTLPPPIPGTEELKGVNHWILVFWMVGAGGGGVLAACLAGCWMTRPDRCRRKKNRVHQEPDGADKIIKGEDPNSILSIE